MPKLIWPNFDFEHELAAGESRKTPLKLWQLNARFAPVLEALCQADDRIVLPVLPGQESVLIDLPATNFVGENAARTSDEFAGPDWELVPWGVTEPLRHLAELRGWIWDQPAIEIVKQLNDRLTACEYERQQGLNPAGAQIVDSLDAAQKALERLPTARWVIKARFGMSARERIMGEGSFLSDSQRGWLIKRLSEQRVVIFEPWLDAVAEAGLQFEIPRDSPPRCLAVLPLMTSATGEYRGSRLFLTEEEHIGWQSAVEIGERIATEAQSLGYFGPLGIDAMIYRDRAEVRQRPVQDINARWTMGRVAWEWGQRLAPGENATWLVGSAAVETIAHLPADSKVIPSSLLDGGSVVSALTVEQELSAD